MAENADYRSLSFWHDTAPDSLEPRPALASDEQVDVAIVGAGYTGLWTAYYLSALQPGIRIALVEAEIAGFGASGRNGGWCVGGLVGLGALLAEPDRREAAIQLQRAVFDSVDEVGRVAEREGIDCHFTKGGSIAVARNQAHLAQLKAELAHWQGLGFGDDEMRWLEPEECVARIRTRPNLGGLFFAPCASLHPMRLARGLARAVETRGIPIYERSPARALEPHRVVTPGGCLRADIVVRATEAYSGSLPGHARVLLPLHSMMIATEPLPERAWKEIGLEGRETFRDPRRMVIYGQRTADDRLAFGGRGFYFFGSGVRDRFSADDTFFEVVRSNLEELFPVLRGYRVTHRWGGAFGIPRDWRPSVGIDRASGLAWAGGYAGEGVAASNLAGRTLAELILERETKRVTLPLVGPPFPSWEPEPLRWLGVNAVWRSGAALDTADFAGRKPPRLGKALFELFANK